MTAPLLSVCIPAYNRPLTIADNLRAVTALPSQVHHRVEIVVTDDSDDDSVERVVRRELEGWSGPATYLRNRSRLGMAANWNASVRAATAAAVVIVHDDDYLLTAGIPDALRSLERPHPAVMLFGVEIVDRDGRRKRLQRRSRCTHLDPTDAVRRLLSNSSFVRFPAMVVSREAYRRGGPFDENLGEAADLDMWLRLCTAHGLTLDPTLLAAYRVHDDALTTGMWHSGTLDTVARIARRVPSAVIAHQERDALLGRFYSQFLLAGAARRLQGRDPAGALRVLDLFTAEPVATVTVPRHRRFARHVLSVVARTRLSCSSARSRPTQRRR